MSAGSSDPGSAPPRYSGIRTFARQEHSRDLAGADVAVVGLPFDTGTSYRPGQRFGPEAIRSASVLLRPYNPVQRVDVLGGLRIVDWGDVALAPGDTGRAIGQIAEQLAPVAAGGAVPLCLGGDHSVALGELRALAAEGGPLGLVLLDSHADTWDEYGGERYFHGTPFRRAVEEGLVDPGRSLLAGMRGSVYSEGDVAAPADLGFEVVAWDELRRLTPPDYAARVRERVGDARAFLSFDVDFLDPAFAPATGTPEPGGPTTAEALGLVRALTGIEFAGFDVVEVSPPYDGPGQVTALAAANIAYEMLSLVALRGAR
ncbi:MAG TPA: agmatinase [Solirubrobacterales bacterium]|nr:agmatinase [Solirubrobacterales bacterium]